MLDSNKVRRVAPFFLVLMVSYALTLVGPSLWVWCAALGWPLLVSASLLVERWWSKSPPQVAVFAAVCSTMPAMHHAWIFNVEGNAIVAWAVPFALGPLLLAVIVARRTSLAGHFGPRRWWFGLIILLCALVYGMDAAYFANTFFDRGPVQHYSATVKARFVKSYFGFLLKEYDLNVNPWGDHKSVDSINVEAEVLEALRVGDEVEIEQLPGLLGIRWVRVRASSTPARH